MSKAIPELFILNVTHRVTQEALIHDLCDFWKDPPPDGLIHCFETKDDRLEVYAVNSYASGVVRVGGWERINHKP